MNCDMCGKEDQLFKTEIEGTMMNVCKNCASYGKVVGRLAIEQPFIEPEVEQTIIRSSKPIPIEIIVTNFASLIKSAREKKDLKQEEVAKLINEKESVLHHVESGKSIPDLTLARKLEKFFSIKLIEQYVDQPTAKAAGLKGKEGMTLADVALIKGNNRR